MIRSFAVISVGLAVASGGVQAAEATLDTLLGGGTLTEADVIFSNFAFLDMADPVTFPNDTEVDPGSITLKTSSTPSEVTLTATISPGLSLAGADGFFEFFLDFAAEVAPSSSRSFVQATLGGGDLFATGDGISEVVYDVSPPMLDLEIFEAPGSSPSSQTVDTGALSPPSYRQLGFLGVVEGETDPGGTAGLSTFAITLQMNERLPPAVIPLPASVLVLLGGLGGLGLIARNRTA